MSREHRHRFGIENILLTSGAMQGLDLIGKVLIDPGDLIVAQFPTYLGALDAWRTRRPHYRKLDWNLDDPDFLGSLPRAKFVYTVPNYSNPTGALVPQNARGGLLSRVIGASTWLVEDDPYLPLQLTGAAGPSILAADAAARPEGQYDGPIIYLGTLSKSVVPGLRVASRGGGRADDIYLCRWDPASFGRGWTNIGQGALALPDVIRERPEQH